MRLPALQPALTPDEVLRIVLLRGEPLLAWLRTTEERCTSLH